MERMTEICTSASPSTSLETPVEESLRSLLGALDDNLRRDTFPALRDSLRLAELLRASANVVGSETLLQTLHGLPELLHRLPLPFLHELVAIRKEQQR